MKICFKGVKNISEFSFTTFGEILSYPGLLLSFRLLKASYISSSVRFASPMRVWCEFRYWSNFVCDSEIIEASFRPMSTKNLLKQFAIFPLIKYFLTIYNHSSRKTTFSWFCSHNDLLDYIPRFLYIILMVFKTSCIIIFLDFFLRLWKRDLYAL